ncbi:hypothetical protein MSAN_01369300 [Mycena sanguinolenta]|uniref:Uncharacterized protein n=1 Tax=Mycena sanguinolenta TaxID=230812 RepID=A0A8H6Y9X0_9AGAR|nr:hypothetical protein MSAN_01369300 [Mycena sanguinolenta]
MRRTKPLSRTRPSRAIARRDRDSRDVYFSSRWVFTPYLISVFSSDFQALRSGTSASPSMRLINGKVLRIAILVDTGRMYSAVVHDLIAFSSFQPVADAAVFTHPSRSASRLPLRLWEGSLDASTAQLRLVVADFVLWLVYLDGLGVGVGLVRDAGPDRHGHGLMAKERALKGDLKVETGNEPECRERFHSCYRCSQTLTRIRGVSLLPSTRFFHPAGPLPTPSFATGPPGGFASALPLSPSSSACAGSFQCRLGGRVREGDARVNANALEDRWRSGTGMSESQARRSCWLQRTRASANTHWMGFTMSLSRYTTASAHSRSPIPSFGQVSRDWLAPASGSASFVGAKTLAEFSRLRARLISGLGGRGIARSGGRPVSRIRRAKGGTIGAEMLAVTPSLADLKASPNAYRMDDLSAFNAPPRYSRLRWPFRASARHKPDSGRYHVPRRKDYRIGQTSSLYRSPLYFTSSTPSRSVSCDFRAWQSCWEWNGRETPVVIRRVEDRTHPKYVSLASQDIVAEPTGSDTAFSDVGLGSACRGGRRD